MKKIVFDASIHLGQFSISSEEMRIACKNSQASISQKPKSEVIGIESFNENSWADDTIWELERDVQDTFYKFMDVFHSVKNIQRVPLSNQDARMALELSEKFNFDISNALTCAIAINQGANEIHTCYPQLFTAKVRNELKEKHGILIADISSNQEIQYLPELEAYYQEALGMFQKNNINMIDRLHE